MMVSQLPKFNADLILDQTKQLDQPEITQRQIDKKLQNSKFQKIDLDSINQNNNKLKPLFLNNRAITNYNAVLAQLLLYPLHRFVTTWDESNEEIIKKLTLDRERLEKNQAE